MNNLVCPKTIAQLGQRIPVLGDYDVVDTGCILDVTKTGIVEARYYENFAEMEELYVGNLSYDSFENFMESLKSCTKKKKVYIARDYAVVLLSKLNGGEPEDYVQ